MWATGVPHLLAQVGPCVLPMFSPHGQNVGAAQRPTCSPPVLPMFSPDVVWHRWGTGGAHVCQPMFFPGLPIRSPAVPHMFNGQFGLPWLKVGHFPAHKIRRYCTVGYYATGNYTKSSRLSELTQLHALSKSIYWTVEWIFNCTKKSEYCTVFQWESQLSKIS